jgi:hypothetical protein
MITSHMSAKHPDAPEPPNDRISWSIYALALAVSGLLCGTLASVGVLPFLAGGTWFWVALVCGGATALVANLVQPRYENTVGWWRVFYDFLLRQMPPPD